jgi:hypothetical protein
MGEPMDERARAGAETGVDRDDEISLRVYFETLWRYRLVIAAALVVVSILFVIAVFGFWLRSPGEKVASIQFRLMFEGAAQNQYPNGIPFSPTDIVGAPVVADVFEANDLKRFGPYEYFKQILYVQQASSALFNLASEYQSKLSDVKLTPVERARLEDEFDNKRKALVDPTFSLSLRRSERFTGLPAGLTQKVLTDVLETWAKQADIRKGALRYQVPVLSSKTLSRDNISNDDYLITVDLLRARAVRIVRSIDELQKLPGALTMRTTPDGTSLPEIRASLEDSIRFDIEPLLGIIRSQGVTKNALQLSMYASNAAFQIRLDKEEIEGRARALQAGLREYMSQPGIRADTPGRTDGGNSARSGAVEMPSVTPQLTESFLDRLEQIWVRTSKEEIEYRRNLTNQLIEEGRRATTFDRDLAYYEDLAKAVKGIGAKSTGSPELVKLIEGRTQKAFDLITKATDDLSRFYQQLSSQNLGPASSLYVITRPFSQHTEDALSVSAAQLLYGLVMLVTLLVVPAGCLIYDAAHKKATARRAT